MQRLRSTDRRVSTVASITQGADEWLDLGDNEDLAFFLDVREISAAKIVYETSPSKQEQSFAALVGAITPSIGQRVDRAFSTFGAVVPARYVRWRAFASAAGAWDVTFRIWVCAYAWVKA